jgi:hypothetical protein
VRVAGSGQKYRRKIARPIFGALTAADSRRERSDPRCGGSRDADLMAASIAIGMRFGVDVFPANWKHYGKAAGYIRNLAMLDTGPDLVLAFQRNGSRGTQHTIDEARRRGIPVEVFTA